MLNNINTILLFTPKRVRHIVCIKKYCSNTLTYFSWDNVKRPLWKGSKITKLYYFLFYVLTMLKQKVVYHKKIPSKAPDGRHLGSPTVMRARICLRPGVALTKQSALERERGGGAIHKFFIKFTKIKSETFEKSRMLNQRWRRIDSWVIFHNINYLGMWRMGGVIKIIIDWAYWIGFFALRKSSFL